MMVSRRQFLTLAGAGVASLAYRPAAAVAPPVSAAAGDANTWPAFAGRLRIVIVGIGGAGASIVSRSLHGRVCGAECIALHRDACMLEQLTADARLLVGPRAPRGLDGGGRPEEGRLAVEHRREDIVGMLGDADLVFVVAGMGGGTATGGAPVVAELARGAGALTVAVVSRPFSFEGSRRNRQARAGVSALTRVCDTTVVVPSDAIIDIVGRHAPYRHALERLDDSVASAVRVMTTMVTEQGKVCVGFADIRAVLQNRGIGGVATGSAAGPARAERAARRALASPLLRDGSVADAGGVLFQIAAADPDLSEVQRVSEIVYEAVGDETSIIFGDAVEPELGDAIRVSLIVAG